MDMTDDKSMDMGGMGMTMTFTSWTDYQLKVVFDWWDITTKWQFAISWFAILLATIGYQGLKYHVERMDLIGDCFLDKRNSGEISMNTNLLIGSTPSKDTGGSGSGSKNIKFIIYHAIMVAHLYGLSLLLMLVAMTYNPWLFIALVLGYGIGDGIFFSRSQAMRKMYGAVGNYTDCH
jgi:hypothetical protein